MDQGINRIVIVGAGQAGTTVAFGLRKAGFNGDITLVRTLRRGAHNALIPHGYVRASESLTGYRRRG